MSRINWRLVAIIIFMLLNGPVSAQTVLTLEIPSEVTVTGPNIQLSELAVINGASPADMLTLQAIKLGTAPIPGQIKKIDRDYLNLILKQYQFSQPIRLLMEQSVAIKVAAVSIEAEEILEKVSQFLPPLTPEVKRRWIQLNRLPEKIWLPKSDWKLSVEIVNKLPELGSALFKVVISNGVEARIMNITGKVRATAVVYQVKRAIEANAILKPEDFEQVEIELKTGKEYLGQFPGTVRSRVSLKEGTILLKHQFETIPLVYKKSQVVVIVKNNQIQIEMMGLAQQDGWLGDQIIISNPISKKTFKGKVIGANTLEVALP